MQEELAIQRNEKDKSREEDKEGRKEKSLKEKRRGIVRDQDLEEG